MFVSISVYDIERDHSGMFLIEILLWELRTENWKLKTETICWHFRVAKNKKKDDVKQ
jgi:hypothetical protein